jgi:aryl-alcohol dehydrogenase-like predicted oxidoreductase
VRVRVAIAISAAEESTLRSFIMGGIRIPTRCLGSTGLVVSRLGLGLAPLGRPAYITPGREHDFGVRRSVADLERRCHEVLDAACAAGIRYFDAARSYGMAEDFLGTWLSARSLPDDASSLALSGATATWGRGCFTRLFTK